MPYPRRTREVVWCATLFPVLRDCLLDLEWYFRLDVMRMSQRKCLATNRREFDLGMTLTSEVGSARTSRRWRYATLVECGDSGRNVMHAGTETE